MAKYRESEHSYHKNDVLFEAYQIGARYLKNPTEQTFIAQNIKSILRDCAQKDKLESLKAVLEYVVYELKFPIEALDLYATYHSSLFHISRDIHPYGECYKYIYEFSSKFENIQEMTDEYNFGILGMDIDSSI